MVIRYNSPEKGVRRLKTEHLAVHGKDLSPELREGLRGSTFAGVCVSEMPSEGIVAEGPAHVKVWGSRGFQFSASLSREAAHAFGITCSPTLCLLSDVRF